MVLVTHDLEECMELAGHVCLMDAGHFTQCGPRERVFARPANIEVARALGIYNILPASIDALDPGRDLSRLGVLGRPWEVPYLPGRLIGDQGYVCVRQAETRVVAHDASPSGNQLLLRVESATQSLRGMRIQFEHAVVAEISEAEYAACRGAERLKVEVPAAAIYFVGK
jgi:ABC-type Fe3+/spermidine/putrescine transport system ATPase subunit